MSFFDFLFPEQAQAMHLRQIANQQALSRSRAIDANRDSDTNAYRMFELEERLVQLENDLGFVALVLGGILTTIEEKGVATRADIWAAIQKVDGMDTFQDGKLDIGVLRRWGNHSAKKTSQSDSENA